MWVFAYGSLVWKADFPYEKTLVGRIKGYVRRFHQKSTDHRGIPSKPGRVVTLIESTNPDDEVWGLAYKIATEDVDNVVNHLDFRERGGYTRKTILFYPSKPPVKIDSNSTNGQTETNNSSNEPVIAADLLESEEKPFYMTIYIGSEDNPNFAGTESIDTIARHIVEATGPSGSNTEYLYKLAAAMRTIAPGIRDEHLFSLEEAVKALEAEREKEVSSISAGSLW